MLFFLFFLMDVVSRCLEVNVWYLQMLQKGASEGLYRVSQKKGGLVFKYP